MPATCEKTASGELPKTAKDSPSLSRRNFIGYATIAAAALGLANIVLPNKAFATTSAEKQAEADEVKRKMDEYDLLLSQYANDYYDAMDAHDQALRNMEEAQGRIDAAVARTSEIQAELGRRARSMYKQGPLSYLDVIFGSSTFVEFSTSWDLLNSINNRDAALIAQCEDARAEAELAREEYAIQEQIAIQKLEEAEEIYKAGQDVMAAYQAELNRLEAEVRQLIEEERRAEEERRRREEEEARRQAQANTPPGGSYGYVAYDGRTFSSIVEAAYSRLGCPYVWAATGPNSFDCSGLTSWCYRQVGIYIPRGGNAQYYNAPMRMSVSEAQPGDILWNTSHVGLCIGGGQFIHAPRPGDVVKISTISGYGWLGAARWY
ncbi:MAG: NlpC/P60 family protein [Coriobacteriia bacterium]|nr:NlpC/P60 family protein [Coriobacteriia bacterium]